MDKWPSLAWAELGIMVPKDAVKGKDDAVKGKDDAPHWYSEMFNETTQEGINKFN